MTIFNVTNIASIIYVNNLEKNRNKYIFEFCDYMYSKILAIIIIYRLKNNKKKCRKIMLVKYILYVKNNIKIIILFLMYFSQTFVYLPSKIPI